MRSHETTNYSTQLPITKTDTSVFPSVTTASTTTVTPGSIPTSKLDVKNDGTLSDSVLTNQPESSKKRRPSMSSKALVILGLSKKTNSTSSLGQGKQRNSCIAFFTRFSLHENLILINPTESHDSYTSIRVDAILRSTQLQIPKGSLRAFKIYNTASTQTVVYGHRFCWARRDVTRTRERTKWRCDVSWRNTELFTLIKVFRCLLLRLVRRKSDRTKRFCSTSTHCEKKNRSGHKRLAINFCRLKQKCFFWFAELF